MSKQTFLKGTFILVMAGLITRILGFINRIVVARIMGQEGVGLYMMAVPTLLLTITLTQLGLPVAISKLVAEAEAMGDKRKVKRILVVSLSITIILSIIFTSGMILLAPFLAKTMLTDARTYYPLIAISPIVPIVAISAVLRGYFQGMQNMRPSAYSQVIEQVVRITLVAVLTKAFLPYGIEFAAAGAMFSVVLGELASLVYMITMFKLKKRVKVRRNFFKQLAKGKETFQSLMAVALPTTGSRLIGSLSYFFEPIAVAQSLAIAGIATSIATKQYGELAGFAVPLLFLPTFITYSISTSLVPAISEAKAQKKYILIEHRLQQAMRLALISGGISFVVLYVFAVPIMDLMYNAPKVAVYVEVLAPFFIFLYFQGPLQATLQALELAKAAMINSLIGAVVRILAIFALTSRPDLGIMGAALALGLGIVLVTLLHFATVVKAIGFSIYIRDYAKAILIIIISGIAGHQLYTNVFTSFNLLGNTILAISSTVIIYSVFLLLFNLIKRKEVLLIPVIGKPLALLIPKNKK
ncbi:stage V sporulation protein B [Lottiidibacillus patelloidae]|uniref:Stage V sporulation protein B n=1 Tax=Lottiidibacillus patelloidae TaxID=2670334 RepID=A0A263BVQ3_9BACI|nr:stage V sporulation protein B [Lottiidibacillus patelloidae]OZM57831.1 stage V sporulation protein B [Lottiidibacillus patelloidae]